MGALEEALDLLGDLAVGTTRERAAAMARGASLLSSLSASEKRELAVSVADKVAPHLVPVIESETGMDLTPNQVAALLQMARQLDAEQIAELRAAVLDDDRRSDLAVGLAGTAARALGFEVPGDLSELDQVDQVEEVEEVDDHLPPPTVPDADDGHEDHEPHELDLDPAAEEAPRLDDEELERFRREREAEVQARIAAETAERDRSPAADESAVLPAPLATTTPASAVEEPVDEPEPRAAPSHDRTTLDAVRAAATPRARRTALERADADALWDLGPAGRRDLLQAFPDGWQRRRAVHVLLDRDVVSADEAVALARTVEDVASRRWVVASLVAAGLLDADDLDGLVADTTAARLTARQGG